MITLENEKKNWGKGMHVAFLKHGNCKLLRVAIFRMHALTTNIWNQGTSIYWNDQNPNRETIPASYKVINKGGTQSDIQLHEELDIS